MQSNRFKDVAATPAHPQWEQLIASGRASYTTAPMISAAPLRVTIPAFSTPRPIAA